MTNASKSSREFLITGGVRQRRVLSPRLVCAVLQVALANWRPRVEHRGVDMNDGLRRLLDLRFADDLLLFASRNTDASYLLDEICAALRAVGLVLNATNTKVLTSEAQAPHQLVTPHGLVVDFFFSHLFTAAAPKVPVQWRSATGRAAPGRRSRPVGHATHGRALEPTGIREELVQSRLRSGSTDMGFARQLEERRGKRSLRSHGNDTAPSLNPCVLRSGAGRRRRTRRPHKDAASVAQRPPTSTPNTTRRQRRDRLSSGYVCHHPLPRKLNPPLQSFPP